MAPLPNKVAEKLQKIGVKGQIGGSPSPAKPVPRIEPLPAPPLPVVEKPQEKKPTMAEPEIDPPLNMPT